MQKKPQVPLIDTQDLTNGANIAALLKYNGDEPIEGKTFTSGYIFACLCYRIQDELGTQESARYKASSILHKVQMDLLYNNVKLKGKSEKAKAKWEAIRNMSQQLIDMVRNGVRVPNPDDYLRPIPKDLLPEW